MSDETPLFHSDSLRDNKFLLYLQKEKKQPNTKNNSDKLEKPLRAREKQLLISKMDFFKRLAVSLRLSGFLKVWENRT